MTKRAAPLVALVALSTAGCGGSQSQIALKITVTRYVRAKPTTVRFALGCRPTSGSLPLAARICGDIARHRQAMLAPRGQRSTCAGGPRMPSVEVDVVRGAAGGGFSGSPGCGWPGGTPIAVYYAASVRDVHMLDLLEPRLRCEDDPAFFAQPTPWASIVACTHGLWTPAAERAIRIAERSKGLGHVRFPADPGVVRCRIPAPHRPLYGLCGVDLTGPASHKVVHLVETWAEGRRVFRHHWTIRGETVVAQSGPTPPQEWM